MAIAIIFLLAALVLIFVAIAMAVSLGKIIGSVANHSPRIFLAASAALAFLAYIVFFMPSKTEARDPSWEHYEPITCKFEKPKTYEKARKVCRDRYGIEME